VSRKDQIVSADSIDDVVRPLFAQPRDLLVKADTQRVFLDAQALLQTARDEAKKIREQGYQAGLQRGLAQLSECVSELSVLRETALTARENDIITLAIAVARKIVDKELREDPALVKSLLEQALGEIGIAQRIVIRLNPEALPLMEQAQQRLKEREQPVQIELKTDSNLSCGDCVIETEFGRIDARLDVLFTSVEQALVDQSADEQPTKRTE